MAEGKYTLTDAFVEVDGVDLSCFVQSVTVGLSKNQVEAHDMCGQDILHGLEASSFTLNLFSSFGVDEVDEVISPHWFDETSFQVVIRPFSDEPVGATNPEYIGTCKVFEYQPIDGSVGDAAMTNVTLPVIGHAEKNITPAP